MKSTPRFIKMAVLLLPILLTVFFINTKAAQGATFSFGVVPQQSATKLLRAWTPILEYLGNQTGKRFEFKTAPDIPTFEARLARGEYDFAYMNPYHFTVFNDQPGYQAIAKARAKQIVGIIVVHKDSDFKNIQDLESESLAFPAPAAFAATLLVQGELTRADINFESSFVNSHDSVYRAVEKKRFVAGGGVMRTYNLIKDSVRNNLRILHKTSRFTPHAIAAHPRVSRRLQALTSEVLSSIGVNGAGPDLMTQLGIKGFGSANNEDWDDVRSLNLSQILSN